MVRVRGNFIMMIQNSHSSEFFRDSYIQLATDYAVQCVWVCRILDDLLDLLLKHLYCHVWCCHLVLPARQSFMYVFLQTFEIPHWKSGICIVIVRSSFYFETDRQVFPFEERGIWKQVYQRLYQHQYGLLGCVRPVICYITLESLNSYPKAYSCKSPWNQPTTA